MKRRPAGPPPHAAGMRGARGRFAARLAALCSAALLAGGATPALALSAAAKYLVAEQVAKGCGGPGRFQPIGIHEGDLTGDSKADLILDHGGIESAGDGRSSECGIRACSVYFYVREGRLLVLKREILSIGAEVGTGSPPGIKLVGHGFEESTLRWNGSAFE